MLTEDLLSIIRERRSIRSFSAIPVTDDEIHLLLEAARHAPSNSNRQPWKFVVVRSRTIINDMAAAVDEKAALVRQALKDPDYIESFDRYAAYLTFFKEAPIVIVALAKRPLSFLEQLATRLQINLEDRGVNAELMSISMAMQNLQLVAHTMGIGTCCMTGPLMAADRLENILNVHLPFGIVAMLPIGRIDTIPPAPKRKDVHTISEIIAE